MSIYEILKNWKSITQALANSAKKILGDVEVVPFGSIIEGKATAMSDLHILIVAKDLPKNAFERAQIQGKIEEETGLPPFHPIQIHLATSTEAETNPIYKEARKKHYKSQ